MCESNQELKLGVGGSQLHDSTVDLSLLRIDAHNHLPCTACGCNGSSVCFPLATVTASANAHCATKRASLEPPSEPNPKNPVFGQDLSAFSKIPLPSTQPFPPLRRCISDPCTPPRAAVAGQPLDSVIIPTPPEGQRTVAGSFSLPRKPAVLGRSASDPTRSPAKNLSRSNDESVSAKRLRRMKDRLKEMNQWVEVIVHEGEEYVGTEQENGEAEQSQESVCVDKVGDCIHIRLKCPCKQGFHILLHGGVVYYKLL